MNRIQSLVGRAILMALAALLPVGIFAQGLAPNKFRQLEEELPTANAYRTASGAPGHAYYQNRADYQMDITLDDDKQLVRGVETITYRNNSPDALTYLWLQLDQNLFAKDADRVALRTGKMEDRMNFWNLNQFHQDFDGGYKIEQVKDAKGGNLPYTINKTMMRIDLPASLPAGGSYTFKVQWWFNINDRMKLGGRSGYEYFPDENNYLYTIAQFFPRMCVYNEVTGWQHKQFLGAGEFTLPFGNYKVNLTVPDDHIVAATGTLVNADKVLSAQQRERLAKARTSDKPVLIVTQDEAKAAEKGRPKGTKTWTYSAENVRDFAFASSRKFMWDGMNQSVGGKNVLCMSYYPKEGNPLWEQYSTRVVAHTIKSYSKYTIDYPYPVAISVHTKDIGMEYPMIAFNGGRPEADGTYSDRTKHGMISVIIHEVGHNFFPMIINSDERQWTWMDEGLNTFVQYLAEQEWDRNYPSRRGPAYKIVDYMKGDRQFISPIMTNSESIHQFGNNAYGKPATALNILRETVMGRQLFDYAFKEYCRRWAFRHPSPADFFRSMEDASGVDLDWFWRGWFFGTDPVDIALEEVRYFQPSSMDPVVEKALDRQNAQAITQSHIGVTRNKEAIPQSVVEADSTMRDFYNRYDPFEPTKAEIDASTRMRESLDANERALMAKGGHYYEATFHNKGGLPMPLILEFTYQDGSKEVRRVPAEIWRFDDARVTKVFFCEKPLAAMQLDPFLETADIDLGNNAWPPKAVPSRFKVFKENEWAEPNPMRNSQKKGQ
jgi:Peptidase family M1 domain